MLMAPTGLRANIQSTMTTIDEPSTLFHSALDPMLTVALILLYRNSTLEIGG